MGKIYYIMGKSASGKDSIFKELKRGCPNCVRLCCIRPGRSGKMRQKGGISFVNEEFLREMQEKKRVIELRSYDTKCGIWKYFTADDGQIDLEEFHYLAIGTLESYAAMTAYFGVENVVPIYVEVEDGMRLLRAVERERLQTNPKYAELCRRFLADSEDFRKRI